MGGEWPQVPLGQVTANLDAKRVPLSKAERSKRPGEIPYYGPTGVFDHVDDFLFEGLHLLVAEDGSVEQDDGTVFRLLADGRFWVNNHAHILRGQDEIDTRWLFYALSATPVRPYISGSVQDKLTQASLNRLPVFFPDRRARERGVDLLGALDDKIELNRRMAETLEAQARALFRSWFVDFDPVRARAEGRSAGLPDPLAALFPARFTDDGLPDGWVSATIADFARLNPESWTAATRPDHIEYVDLANTKWGRIEVTSSFNANDAPSRAQRVTRIGDTIVGTVRPGNGAYALINTEGLTASTAFAVLRPRNSRDIAFVYLALTDARNIESLASLADGGAYPAVRPGLVAETSAIRPSEVVLRAFNEVAQPLLSRVQNALTESTTFAALRDTLLPKLISGELRIRDAERAVAAA